MSLHKKNPYVLGIDSLLKEECVFFGTGHISRHALEALSSVFSIEAVITKSDRTHNTRRKPTAVAEWAKEKSVECLHADTSVQVDEIFARKHFRSQFAVVVDYGVIISRETIDYFPHGIINSHFSLLPKYRGPDPIRSALIAGDDKTGVTLMQITPGLDEGPIISQQSVEIDPKDTAHTLTQKLLTLNASMLRNDIHSFLRGDISPTAQDESQATWTKKLAKQDGLVKKDDSAEVIERKVRAYQPWPGVRTTLFDTPVILTQVSLTTRQELKPGSVSSKQGLYLGTTTSDLHIERLKPENKREMSAEEFIRGYGK